MKRSMEKRILDAEKKVNNFYFLANKNLLRAAKKWLGVRKLNLAKQAKAAAQSKEKGVAATAQIETLKRITPAMLSTSGLLRLQIFEHNNPSSKVATPGAKGPKEDKPTGGADGATGGESDVGGEDGKSEVLKRFFASKIFLSASKDLIETRRKRNKELRHLKERLGRKDRRQQYKDIKEKRRGDRKPLPSQKEMFMEASTLALNNNESVKKKRKNRLGQRERKRRAEAREREEAISTKRVKPNRKERRELERKGLLKPKKKKQAQQQLYSTENKQAMDTKELAGHHPSWDAKRKKELEEKSAKFAGTKVTFDYDSDGSDSD